MKKLFKNGNFYTPYGIKKSVAVVDGIIQNVYDEDVELQDFTVYDVEGNFVLPGFNDAHLHLYHVGAQLKTLRFDDVTSISTMIIKAKEYLMLHSKKVLFGYAWNQDKFTEQKMPSNIDLDEISMEIPIIFYRVCGHIAVVNSKAIELLGITTDTTIAGGAFLTHSNGKLNGIITENALQLLEKFNEQDTYEEIKQTLQDAISYVNRFGITSVQPNDIRVSEENSLLLWRAYQELQQDNKLTVRVALQSTFPTIEEHDRFFSTFQSNAFLKAHAYKTFADGSLGARTASLTKPYADDESTQGVLMLNKNAIKDIFIQANQFKRTVIIHAIGDGAIQAYLEAFEETNPPTNPLRHGIIHCQITTKEQLEAIARNQILIYAQPIFIDYDMDIVVSRVGHDKANTSYAFKTLLKSTPTSFSSDAPVEDVPPFAGIYCAVTRKNKKKTKLYRLEEACTLEEAIDAYTVHGAYMSFDEHEKGKIETGFVADFAIMDKNPFNISIDELLSIDVVATIVHGEEVYKKE